ncbi:hypothetical protein BRADI_3g43665v3 [Brachypodium distachyon]|uniref:Uncharacterized protein n=1 Tax=Brachypodium distachyon TaxID=15368 RepID=A0A2K2D302_BRADI|nr:hypothetical protein BRADI_3g43665v3 [Brachypodium distachyon]
MLPMPPPSLPAPMSRLATTRFKPRRPPSLFFFWLATARTDYQIVAPDLQGHQVCMLMLFLFSIQDLFHRPKEPIDRQQSMPKSMRPCRKC